jgi:hypothetical protein
MAPANREDEAELGLCFSEMAPLPTIRALPCREIGLIIHCEGWTRRAGSRFGIWAHEQKTPDPMITTLSDTGDWVGGRFVRLQRRRFHPQHWTAEIPHPHLFAARFVVMLLGSLWADPCCRF